MIAREQARQWWRQWWRPFWSLVGLVVAYYAFPERGEHPALEAVEIVLTCAGLGLLGVMIVREVQHIERGEEGRGTPALVTLLILVVMSFSFAFYVLDQLSPRQMVGLHTRTDALYFTLSTMATVGYGDVHARGQLARILVILLIVFNVLVVAGLLRALPLRRATAAGGP